jgi:hypothetical protein
MVWMLQMANEVVGVGMISFKIQDKVIGSGDTELS